MTQFFSMFLGSVVFLLVSCGQGYQLSSVGISKKSLHVMSYNVENLWDLVQDKNKQNYDDFDLKKTNYAKKADANHNSYMAVKIANIIRVIKDFDQPEIVALQEVETLKAVEELMGYNDNELVKLGYEYYRFPEIKGEQPAVGNAVISKRPIRSVKNVYPLGSPRQPQDAQRPILRVEITLESGEPLFVYNNHWKSKSGPESKRMAYARGLIDDIKTLNDAHYVIVGDLNSNYNESTTILQDRELNDTNGETGINTVLKTQSHTNLKEFEHFNPYYDIEEDNRKSVYSGPKYGWGSFDHIIVGKKLIESEQITYDQGSFTIAPQNQLPYLWTWNENEGENVSRRWIVECNKNRTKCTHRIGGYSDHLPIRVRLSMHQ